VCAPKGMGLTRGHNVSDVVAVRDDRDRLATFGPAHDFCPRRLILGPDHKPWLAHGSMADGPTGSGWSQTAVDSLAAAVRVAAQALRAARCWQAVLPRSGRSISRRPDLGPGATIHGFQALA